MDLIYAGVLWGALGLGLACILLCARGSKSSRTAEPASPDQPKV